ncbi:leucine-rich repeat and guanylate kinase domain-containing protein isoform X1 [Amphiprion ocellaris]|uniref:leucine-rich repeat and guanylate kinase domain-containing protein isoform X1 n=1 Tax=Amphiprion ocellaris TaxID=80972 RepID=UPI002410BC85|nr:leucine-rich repeat and guanylate kinase domain-containing protein isoform X1 [Amphiprion ocellaris]
MTETTSPQFFSSSSPSCYPPGSLTDAPSAENPSCGETHDNTRMEVKQVTLYRRSGEVKLHSKKDGVLTAQVVSSSISQLGLFGTGLQRSYHSLSLPSHNLSDISILCNYVYLQKLELPHNKIKDLSCVSHMPYLVILDASHNEISNFFEFQPPKNLKEVNFSHNRMTKMKDLSAYLSLNTLNLDHNNFREISGLEQCCKLTHLSLAHNKISRISGLDSLPVTHLCLRGNQLEMIEGLENLKSLQVLDLSLNRISSLSGLQNLHLLGSIDLEKNLISEIQECKHIHNLLLLRDLNLLRNPVQEQPDYRLAVIFLLQHLTMLDQKKVTAEEKVSSVNKYDPPLDVVAARDHMTHLVYQLMQPQVLYDSSTLPSPDSPYPMLVLTGPQGCGKRELAHRLCQEFSEYFAHGTCHTTRAAYFGEENGLDYHFVSEEDFQNMIPMGKFIQTLQYGGHSYGLTRDAIEEVAREGLACCVHMELEGVFSLKNSYFEPRYILLIPIQVEKYTDHLKKRGLYSQAQIDAAVSRIELYANTNKQRPGFFDNIIPCDDREEAYQMLRQAVKGYLLLEEQEEGEDNIRASPDNTSTASGHEPEEKPLSPLLRSGSGSLSVTALDPSDPSYRSYFTKIQAELSPQKCPAELASIRRRERLVREAIVGKSPGVYSQLFKSSAQTASSSLHNKDTGTHFHEDSSSDDSRASSALSVPSSAGASSVFVEPLDASVLGHTKETVKASGQPPDTPRPGTDQAAAVVSPTSDRRPGSNVKPILPPIPTGRKTPAAPSPAPSPRPSPNPAVGEGGDADMEGKPDI